MPRRCPSRPVTSGSALAGVQAEVPAAIPAMIGTRDEAASAEGDDEETMGADMPRGAVDALDGCDRVRARCVPYARGGSV